VTKNEGISCLNSGHKSTQGKKNPCPSPMKKSRARHGKCARSNEGECGREKRKQSRGRFLGFKSITGEKWGESRPQLYISGETRITTEPEGPMPRTSTGPYKKRVNLKPCFRKREDRPGKRVKRFGVVRFIVRSRGKGY